MSHHMNPGLTTLEGRIRRICGVIDEMKGEAITVLDLHGLSDFTDAFIIATARSRTHLQGIAQQIDKQMRDEGIKPLAKTDLSSDRWAVIDYGDLVVHVLDAEGREFYALEQLWGDAPEIAWQGLAAMA